MDNTILIAVIAGIVSVITGGLASIPGILALRQQKRKLQAESERTKAEAHKQEADAARIVQDMAIDLIEPYRARITELEAMVKKNNTELTERIEKLEAELESTHEYLMEVADCAQKLYNQILKDGNIEPECSPPDPNKLAEKIGKSTKIRKRG